MAKRRSHHAKHAETTFGQFGSRRSGSLIVESGFLRTELLTPDSTRYAESTIGDYAERPAQTVAVWKGMNCLQGGYSASPPTR